MAEVKLRDVAKSFGDVPVLRDVNLTIGDGEFVYSSARRVAASRRCCG